MKQSQLTFRNQQKKHKIAGGSLSNMYGMICARQRKFPEIKQNGLRQLEQLVLFVSDGVRIFRK